MINGPVRIFCPLFVKYHYFLNKTSFIWYVLRTIDCIIRSIYWPKAMLNCQKNILNVYAPMSIMQNPEGFANILTWNFQNQCNYGFRKYLSFPIFDYGINNT